MFETTTFIKHSPYAGIFLLLVLGDMGFPVPEDATLLLSGFLIAHGVTRPLLTLLVVYGGLLITDFSLYWMGKKYGRRVVEHRRFQKILSLERLSVLEEKFKKWGIFVVFVGRHFLGVRAQVFIAAGVMRMPAIKFIMADAASAVVTVTLTVGMGYLAGSSLQVLKKDITRVEHLAVLAVVILLLAGLVFKYIKNSKLTPKKK